MNYNRIKIQGNEYVLAVALAYLKRFAKESAMFDGLL